MAATDFLKCQWKKWIPVEPKTMSKIQCLSWIRSTPCFLEWKRRDTWKLSFRRNIWYRATWRPMSCIWWLYLIGLFCLRFVHQNSLFPYSRIWHWMNILCTTRSPFVKKLKNKIPSLYGILRYWMTLYKHLLELNHHHLCK